MTNRSPEPPSTHTPSANTPSTNMPSANTPSTHMPPAADRVAWDAVAPE